MITEQSSHNLGLSTPYVIKHLVSYQKGPFIVHSFFTIITFGMQVIPGLIVKTIFDTISGSSPSVSFLGIDHFVWLILLFVLTELLALGMSFGAEWYGWTFRLVVGSLMRSNVFASILRRRADQPLDVSSGEIINRLEEDVGEIGDFPTWLPDQLGKWIAAIIAVIIMANIDLTITLVIFIPLIGTMLLTRLAWGKMLVYSRQAAEAGDKVAGFMGEVFGAVQSVKVADAERAMTNRLQELSDRRAQFDLRFELSRGILNSINSSVVTFGVGVVLLLAGKSISTGIFTVGDFALFVNYLWFTTQVPSELGTFYGDFKTQQVSIERLLTLIRPDPEQLLVKHHPVYINNSPPLPSLQIRDPQDSLNTVEIMGLSYKHQDSELSSEIQGDQELKPDMSIEISEPVRIRGIDNVYLTINKGEFIVVTGRVGSGKSTLLRVLLGLLPHSDGEVRWNGRIINDLATFMRPPRAAYISQIPRLFSETILENILMGLPQDQYDYKKAIELSVLDDDIKEFDNGLNTLVGPRGIRLSGGQMQRVAAARIFVRDVELIMFDDLSSALDINTENTLWERVDTLRKGAQQTTCLVVSHRRPALMRADRIVMMKAGRVEAIGTLNHLLNTSLEMQYLWRGVEE